MVERSKTVLPMLMPRLALVEGAKRVVLKNHSLKELERRAREAKGKLVEMLLPLSPQSLSLLQLPQSLEASMPHFQLVDAVGAPRPSSTSILHPPSTLTHSCRH